MPIYEYECANCKIRFQITQNIRDKALKKCKNCHKLKLERLLFEPLISVRASLSETKTVGHYAAKKTEKMGKIELEDLKKNLEKKDKKEKKWPEGWNPIDQSKLKRPWWRKGPPDLSLANLTPKQKQDYILNGKKPTKVKPEKRTRRLRQSD